MIVNDFFKALRAGKELANAETWKDAQQLGNALTMFLVAIVALAQLFGIAIPLTEAQIRDLASGVFPVLVVFNWIAAAVSSKRVGLLPGRRDDPPAETADSGGNRSDAVGAAVQRDGAGADAPVSILNTDRIG